MTRLVNVRGLSILTQCNCSWIYSLLVPRRMGTTLQSILSQKSKIPGLCTQTQMENYCCGWMVRSSSTKSLIQAKTMVRQPYHAKCATSFRGISKQCDKIFPDTTYKVQRIGFNFTKFWNLSSQVCCVVFETRMAPIQKRTRAPCKDVICGLRARGRNLHTIVNWSRRRNPTGPWYQRTKVDGSQEGGKISELQNPVRMCLYGVLGVKRCFGNGIYTKTFPQNTPIWRWPLLPSEVSQCSHMKEITSRVSSRIRDRRWLPSVSRMKRIHTTVIIGLCTLIFILTTQTKSRVRINACLHQYLYTSISIKNGTTQYYIYIWIHTHFA